MKFNANNVSKKFQQGLFEYKSELDIDFDEQGVSIYAVTGRDFSVDFDGKTLNIRYKYEAEFYRAIALFFAHEGKPFKHKENRYFDDFGVHNSTRTYAPNIPYVTQE